MKWTNREGKEVSLQELDNNFLLSLLDKFYSLAVIKQEMTVSLYSGFKGAYFQGVAESLGQLSWRDFTDQIFSDVEYEAAYRRLGWEPKPLSSERKVNLSPRGALERYIVGALRDAIRSHGPVTYENTSSAAKRLIGAIKAFTHDQERK